MALVGLRFRFSALRFRTSLGFISKFRFCLPCFGGSGALLAFPFGQDGAFVGASNRFKIEELTVISLMHLG